MNNQGGDEAGRPGGASPEATQYVVLHHVQRDGAHYDLMIDMHGMLATWKFEERPDAAERSPVGCRRIADHRIDYLEYEGPISGDRGRVTREDRGECKIEWAGETALHLHFKGRLLHGGYILERGGDVSQGWVLRRLGG